VQVSDAGRYKKHNFTSPVLKTFLFQEYMPQQKRK